MDFTLLVWKKGVEYIANCPELDIYCYGKDEPQAKKRLQSVISFYVDTASELGYSVNSDHLPNIEDAPSKPPNPSSVIVN